MSVIGSTGGSGTPDAPVDAPSPLPWHTSLLLAAVCAVTISGVYLPQALLSPMAEDLDTTVVAIGGAATLAQLGYAAGIVLLVPLIGRTRPRFLLTAVMAASVVTLLVSAASPGAGLLAPLFLLVGLASVTPQLLVPLAHRLTDPAGVRRLLAALTGGIGLGIFGSRLVAGALAEAWGWRVVPCVFAGLVLVLGWVCWRVLPTSSPSVRTGYLATIASLPRLAATRPVLRQSMMIQFGGFFALNAIWTVGGVQLVELGWSELAASAFGTAGVLAAMCAPLAGALIGRLGPARVVWASIGVVIVAALAIAVLSESSAVILVGAFVMTVGALWAQIAHQVRFFAENPTDRAGANIDFMVSAFGGGAFGALGATAMFEAAGMTGVALLAGAAALAGLGLALIARPRRMATAG